MKSKRNGIVGAFAYGYAGLLAIYYGIRVLGGNDLGLIGLFDNFVPLALLPAPLLAILGWRRRNLALMAAGVGYVATLVRSLRLKARAKQSGPMLRVLTHNVGRQLIDEDRLLRLIKDSDAELVLLQEISEDCAARCFKALVALYPYSAFGALSLLDRDMGMAVMSRHPILSNEDLKLTEEGIVVQQRVRVKLHLEALSIYNVHLTLPWIRSRRVAWFPLALPFYDDDLRRAEVKALLDLVCAERDGVLMGGDFNLHDHSADHARLTAVLIDAFDEAGHGWGFSWPLNSSPGINLPLAIPIVRIDYLFASKCFSAISCRLLNATGSDHRPLLVELGLRDAAYCRPSDRC